MDSTLEDKVTSTVQAIIEIAVELGSSVSRLAQTEGACGGKKSY